MNLRQSAQEFFELVVRPFPGGFERATPEHIPDDRERSEQAGGLLRGQATWIDDFFYLCAGRV